MSKKLPRYKPLEVCPKCGNTNITTFYEKKRHYLQDDCKTKGEHLDRTCTRCRYSWPELLVDKATLQALEDSLLVSRPSPPPFIYTKPFPRFSDFVYPDSGDAKRASNKISFGEVNSNTFRRLHVASKKIVLKKS